MAIKSVMVSCSVAQATHLVKAGVYVMPARHDQEGAPQVGSNGRNSGPDAIELPRAQATQHPDAPVALWSGCARPGREPPYSEQGQATRR